MRKPLSLSLSIFFCMNTFCMSNASGATCNVPAAYTLLEDAVNDATCTEIVVGSGYFVGGVSTLDIDRDLVIRGAGIAGPTGTTLNYHMLVTNDAVLTLEDLSIDAFARPHGVELSSNAAGVIGTNISIYTDGAVSVGWGIDNTFGVATGNTFATLTDCAIFGNAGGINVPTLTMTRCDVYGNNVHGGVAISSDSTIRHSNIYDNRQTGTTDDGAGIKFRSFDNRELLIEHSNIYGNETHIEPTNAVADGGGVMVTAGRVTIRNSEIYDNLAARRGGGIAVHNVFDASLTLEDSIVRNNVAYEGGGGISVGNDTTIRDSQISNNTARRDSDVNVNGVGNGGGVYVFDSPILQIFDTTISENMADSASNGNFIHNGGGIYVDQALFVDGEVWIERSTINGNYARKDGGGVFGRLNTTLNNVTVADNRAGGDGGGVYGNDFGVRLLYTTVVGNVADFDADGSGDGGGLAGSMRTEHTLIALNDDPTSPDLVDCSDSSSGSIQSLGYSLLGVSDGCASFKQTGTDLVGDSATPLDPMLILPLAKNGGRTQTILLDPGSPAIDAGSPTCGGPTGETMDQRRGTRPQDGDGSMTSECDIGALELRPHSCSAGPVVITGPQFYAGQIQVSSTTTLSTTGEVVIVAGSVIDFIADVSGSISFGNGFSVEDGAQFVAELATASCPP